MFGHGSTREGRRLEGGCVGHFVVLKGREVVCGSKIGSRMRVEQVERRAGFGGQRCESAKGRSGGVRRRLSGAMRGLEWKSRETPTSYVRGETGGGLEGAVEGSGELDMSSVKTADGALSAALE